MVDVSIIIVNYNTKELTLDCLQSVYNETKNTSFEIIVVDNASKDNSATVIKEKFHEVELIASKTNIGFARANNLAAELAKGRYILLLNPDTIIIHNAIDSIVKFAKSKPQAGIWGGVAQFPDGTTNVTCWNKMTPWSVFCRAIGLSWLFPNKRFLNPESIHKWDSLKCEREVDIIVGCFLLIEKSLWNRLRGFDPVFFMYGEEVDLCLRAKKQFNAQPSITPEASIIHFGGGSEPSSEDKLVKVLKGQITVMKAHWSKGWFFYGRLILILMVWLRAVGSIIIPPPQRQGAGLDGRNRVWGSVFRRRDEWLTGWTI